MKKILLLTATLGMFSGVFAKKVKFQVDMTGQTVSANGVHIAGDFQSEAGATGDWQPNATALTNGGSGNVYSVIVDIPAGKFYEFKFINGNDWPGAESVPALNQKGHTNNGQTNDNRWLFIDSIANDTTIFPAVIFGTSAPANKVAVRFAVDMQKETAISANGVHIAGSLQNWDPSATSMVNLYTSNKVYEYIAYVDTGSYEYKFVNGNGWNAPNTPESVPSTCEKNGNRHMQVTANTALTKVCFASCIACPTAPLPKYNITFNVDMSNSDCDGGFDSVSVAGARTELTNWTTGVKLSKVGTTQVYSAVIQLDSGEVKFKFRYHKNGNTNWEGGGDRTYTLMKDSALASNCFGSTSPCVSKPAPSTVTFKVDLSNEVPDAQGRIYVMGTFQTPNWQAGALRLSPVSGQPGVFSVTVNNVCPGSFNYKFLNGDSSLVSSEENFPDTASRSCLEANGIGGFNRKYTRVDANPVTLGFVYNKCTPVGNVGLANEETLINRTVLFPNPTNDIVHLVFNNSRSSHDVTVTDVTGRVIKSYHVSDSTLQIAKEQIGTGIFFISITNNRSETKTMKLVVQ